MTARHRVAIDLGAASGRVMLACFEPKTDSLTLREIHRFTNHLRSVEDFVTWDLENLEQEILTGLKKACAENITISSIGIDTWGVDYVLLDKTGQRLGLPVSYRDNRTAGVMEEARRELGEVVIFERTGIQFQPFNTLYQLRALTRQQPDWLDQVEHALLLPDYFCYRLTGKLNWEYTNATTTQLINLHQGDWDNLLLDWAGVPRKWFATPTAPGNTIGYWQSPTHQSIAVVAVATHDTASAVLAVPMADQQAVYLCSGTWSLMGFESETPYTSDAARAANITNEGGVDGRYRVLKNIMGLWLFQRVSHERNMTNLAEIIAQASLLPCCRSVINPNDSRFINPSDMCQEIEAACRESHQPVPQTDSEIARCIFDSLSLLYARVLEELVNLRGHKASHLHIVGGGSQNHLLNQLCADACGVPVLAGPIEASTLGNIGCQLMASGDIHSVEALRKLVADNYQPDTFHPQAESEMARYVAQAQFHRQTSKEFS